MYLPTKEKTSPMDTNEVTGGLTFMRQYSHMHKYAFPYYLVRDSVKHGTLLTGMSKVTI